MASDSSEVVVGLLHGSWHGSWCWDNLKYELLPLGYESITVDFPKDVPFADFNVYRDEAVYQLESEARGREIALVAHSRAANVAPRIAHILPIKHIVYLCGSFEPATLHPLIQNGELDSAPAKYSKDFLAGMQLDEEGFNLTTYDPEQAAKYFFHDCPEEIQKSAVDQLSMQYKSSEEPLLQTWPDTTTTPQTYVMGTKDKVIQPKWSEYIATEVIGIPLEKIDTGHSPFYAKPRQLAKLLIQIINTAQ